MKFIILFTIAFVLTACNPVVLESRDSIGASDERVQEQTQVSGTAVLALTLLMAFAVSTLANDYIFDEDGT